MTGADTRVRIFCFALAFVLAAYAQHIIGLKHYWAASVPGISSFDAKLTDIYAVQQSVAVAIPLFAIAMVLFAWSVGNGHGEAERSVPDEVTIPAGGFPKQRTLRAVIFVGAASLGGWVYLIARLATDHYEGWYVALFFLLIACTGSLCWLIDRIRDRQSTWQLQFGSWEILFVVGVASLFFGLVCADLTNWRYSTLGDDGTFFLFSRSITHGAGLNLFSQAGPAGNHPLLSSAYQAAVMNLAGVNIFGWKLATLLVLVATLPVFYILLRTFTDSRVAVLATGVLASSHYLLGYAHTGYDNVFPLLPTVLALTCFTIGIRRSSVLLLFCAGAAAGLGFYTFYSSRAAIVILAILVLLLGRRHWRMTTVLPLTVGFVLTVAPLFAVEGWNVISEMQAESQASGNSLGETLLRLAANAPRAFLAFNFDPYPKHYVSGSLLDDATAPLALLGFGYALTRLRDSGYQVLVVWFLVAILVAGLFHPRPAELNSRLHYALPPMAAFAALAMDRIIDVVSSLVPKSRARAILVPILGFAFLSTILGLNLYRHWVVSPRELPVPNAALVLREAQRPACDLGGTRSVVFAAHPFPVMPLVFEFYEWQNREPFFFRFDDPPDLYRSIIQDQSVACILVADPDASEAGPVVSYVTTLSRQSGQPVQRVTDTSRRTALLVLRLHAK